MTRSSTSLVLINHLADIGTGAVSQQPLLKALAATHYLKSHAHRIYGSGDEAELAAAKAILARIKTSDLKDGFSARDVHQRGWSHLTEREHVAAGLRLLVDLDSLADSVAARSPQGGRPKVTYSINPRIWMICLRATQCEGTVAHPVALSRQSKTKRSWRTPHE